MSAISKKEFLLTQEGIDKLRAELEELTTNGRREIAAQLKEAKEYGDLKENSQWDEVKDRQAFVEGRIAEIDNILKNTSIIEAKSSNEVAVGSTVHVELEEGLQKFTIVGSVEADPEQGKISYQSPIGQALLGRRKGDQVEVTVPAGTMTYKIVEIK